MGEKEVDLEKEPEKPVENEDGSLSIAVDETPDSAIAQEEEAKAPEAEETPKAEEPKEEPKFSIEDERRKNAQAFYNLRAEIRKKEAEIAELRGQKKPATKTREELETELSKQPVSTIEEIVEARVNAALEAERQRFTAQSEHARILEESKNKAREKHPELDDSSSVKSQAMIEVLTNHPDWVNNPYGPVLAMVEMENVLARRGIGKTPAVTNKIPVSALPAGRNLPKTTKTITLTKEQLLFCKENNIDPKLYAKNVRVGSGVEV